MDESVGIVVADPIILKKTGKIRILGGSTASFFSYGRLFPIKIIISMGNRDTHIILLRIDN